MKAKGPGTYDSFLTESYEDNLKNFLKVLDEHPELSVLPLNMCPGKKPISKIYRTVKQTDFFEDCYGEHGNMWMRATYVGKGKFPETLPDPVLVMRNVEGDPSTNEGWESTTDWTIDDRYWYRVHDEVIRVCLDFNKVLSLVGPDNVLNLLYDGEAEIRLRNEISMLECLHSIDISRESYYYDQDGEYGVDRAIKTYFPKQLIPYLNLVHDAEMTEDTTYSKALEKYYEKAYMQYSVEPVKAYGNTWISA